MSRAFRLILQARERLYEAGFLQILRLEFPVISVGNLTLGGTGKTPLVIALAERLRRDGLRPVVLSRGYKRTSAGVVIVSRGNGPLVKWYEAGDEPYMIAQRAPGVAVVVGADRYAAGKTAEKERLGNVFILDDGFQHRRLFRNVDIVTIDPEEWFSEERLLPSGRWREPKDAVARADAACVREVPGFSTPSLPTPAFTVQTVAEGIYRGHSRVPIESVRGRAVVAFAGIARPERFFASLEALGIVPIRRVRFRDHHPYRAKEIENLGGEMQITTEKDVVRLEDQGMRDFLHLRISAKIPEFDRLMELIRSRLH